METQTYIECKKNSHGSVLYVYSQSPRSEEDPQLLEEIILPESSEDVYKVVNNDTFIVASFVNHGTQIVPGTGGVMVFKKRNDGKFHFIQTIKLDSEKIVITDENQLNFGIDLELTDENLFITCTPTIENGDKHSYIGVYEYGEFFWELVQEFYGADADNASFKLDEFAYDQLTGKSIYGGINSLAATTTDFVFCSNITESEERPQNQKGFYSCIKLNGTWLLDVENPILHPQCKDDVVGGTVVDNSTKIIGKPCMFEEWLSVSSYKCIKNSELENKLPNEDGDAISFIPCVLIYKKDDDGMFTFFQYLEYEEKCRLSVISEYENITVQMRGDHLVCYDENNLNTTLQEKVEAKYFYLDRTEKVRIGSFGKTYCWKYDSDFDFDGLKKPFILGGCPPCHIKDASCGQVVLHLQSTNSEEVVSDACHDTDITDINHRSPMCDLYLNNIENELGYVFNPLTNLTEDVTIDYTQAHNQNASNRWVTYGNYTNLPIELTPRFLSPDSQLRFVHMHNTSTWHIIDPFNHSTGGMRGLQGTLRSTGMNQGALTYTFAKPTMVIAVTTLTSSWNHGAGIIGSWTQYTPRWEADRTCYTVYYKYFEAGDHVITNQGFFLYFRPLDLIPTPTPTVTPIPAPSCDVTLSFKMVLPAASDNGATFTKNLSISQSDSFQEIENVRLFSSQYNDNLSTWNATDLTLTLSSGEEVDVYFKDATTPAETMSNGNAGNVFVVTLIIPPINSDCSFGSTPTPTPTYKLHEMIMNAGRPDHDGLILISWEDREECLPYTANGRNRLFVVPDGVTQINVQVWGAGGGSGRYRYAGGAGGYADGKLDVQPGETYIIGVGQTAKSRSNTPGYSPGGSAGSGGSGAHRGAGAGGGMSGVFKDSVSIENALLIAGGGGGSSGSYQVGGTGGGGGGGTSGGHGSRGTRDNHGGKGGSQTSGGYRGNSLAWSRNSSSGSQFNGGHGGTAGHSSGGGGGAGWFGGGGGGALSGADSAGGGGAGYTHSSVIDGRLFRGDNGRRNHVGVSSYLPNPMPCVFVEPTPTPSPTPTPTPDCPKINWDIVDEDGNTLSKQSDTVSVGISSLEYGQQRYTNILTGMVGTNNDARVIRWGVKDYSSVSNIKLVLCDGSEHDPLEKEFLTYPSGTDETGLRMNLIFGAELTPTPIPQPSDPLPPVSRPEIPASTCETQYVLLQPATDDTAILDKGSETFTVTEKGETKLNSDTKHFDLPTIKVANGDESYPPNNTLETNIGDMIIGTNDFTIETFIKFDDVNQDHRIINHNETSRNRSSWLLFHRGDRKENNGEEGRWFEWDVNNGHGSGSEHNNWVNHISFLSPISLENNTWYHIALVRKNVTNWAFYVNGQKHERLTNRFMHSSAYSFGSYSGSIPSFSGPTYIGCNHYSTSGAYYMQSFRVTNVAVYADEFNVPSSTLGAIDFKPSCESISVDLQKSDSDDSIENDTDSNIDVVTDLIYESEKINFTGNTQSVKLTANYKIPNHPTPATANGTASIATWFHLTDDETIVDHRFVHSIHYRIGGSNVTTWEVSNAKLTYPDGTIVNVTLRDRKNVRETVSHGANGMQDGHSVKYTFDIPYTKSGADKIIVGNNSDLNFLHNGTTDYTIEFDFNATDLTGTGKNTVRLFSNVVNSSESVAVDCFVRSNGELTFNIHRGVLRTAYKSFVSPEDTISVNTDYKIAIVFSGGQIKIFLNGIAITNANTTGYSIVNSASKSNATRSLIIGGIEQSNEVIDNFKGSIANFKIVRSALYNCNYDVNAVSNECLPPKYYAVTNPDGDTKLLIRSTTSDGIKDIGCQNRIISINGDTAHTESSKLFDTGTINFDGSDSISIPNSKDAFKFLHSGVGADFTVESWIKITQANSYQTIICTASNTGNTGFMLVVHGMKPSVLIGKSVGGRWRLTCGSNTLLNLNTWHHVAVVNVNGKVKLFVDGKLTGESEFTDTIVNLPTHNVSIGCEDDHRKQNYFVGQLQDLRISSSAVYSGRFQVPSALFTTDCSNACSDPELINCANDVVLHLQSNTFKSSDPIVDSSVFSCALTKYGNVTHNTSKSPFGRSSLYFDGDGDYLKVESSTNLQFGTGDFTIEFWVNFPTSSSHFYLQNNKELTTAEGTSRWVIEVKPTQISFITHSYGDTISNSDNEINVNEWCHLAFVRKNGVMTIYYNGEEIATGELDEDYDQNGLNIGSHSRTDGNYTSSLAFVQDLRITNKAVYTTCFSKPTSMLEIAEAIPANEPSCGEVALNIQSDTDVKRSVTLQWYMLLPNHSIENHANGTLSHDQTFDITEDVTKVDQWFMYSNSKVIGRNTGNWTTSAEPRGVNPNKANLTYNDTGETVVVDLTNRKLTLAQNGAGHNLTFNFDVPYGKELPSIEDISQNAHSITKVGDVNHSTTQSILGSSSLKFGGGDYLSINNLNNFGAGDFTIEFWIYQSEFSQNNQDNTSQVIGQYMATRTYHNIWNVISRPTGLNLYWNDGNDEENAGASGSVTDPNFSLNTWTHYAFVRKDTVLYMYSNGQLVDTNTIHTKTINECPLTVGVQMYDETLPYDGTRPGGGIQYPDHFKGYLQDIRISNKAVYTGCFVPPSKLHPNLLNTPLNPNCAEVLLHVQSNTTNVSDAVVDSSRNQYEFTKRGNATHSTDQKIHGASSLYFDGDGDALSINNADTLNGDFTFETWINLKNIPAESEFTLPSEVSSSAIDGELLEITEDTTLEYTDDRISALTTNTITLTSKSGSDFKTNQRLLIITTYGANADTIGNYEFVEIASINGNVLTLKSNIQKTYDVANYTFVVAPKRYNKIIVNEDVNVSSVAWSASSDSIQGLVLLSANEIQVKGQISANELGFRGGTVGTTSNKNGGIGESYVVGKWNTRSTNGQYGSGGGGVYYNRGSGGDIGTSGAGAGHGTSGTGGSSWYSSGNAKGGTAFALDTIKEKIFMGPGGGQGGSDNANPHDSRSARGGYGGRGAGIVIIDAIYCEVSETGIISANGQRGLEAYDPGNGEAGNGGGGAGGSVLFTGNIDNEGIIQTTRGDRRVADGSGQSGGYGYTSGYGGHGVIAWFGYNVGNNQINCLAHSPWKNTSYILDTHSTETTDFGGNKLGLIAIPSKESGKYDVVYGNFGGKLIRSKLNLTYNEWNHIAVVRKNDIETFYINGSPVSTRTHSLDYPNEIIALGSQSFNNFEYPLELNGYLQDVRISTKAVVEGCFVPPVSLVDNLDIVLPNQPECDEINLWLRSDTNIESSAITDTSKNKHSIAKHGNARHETSKKLFGESALYFDGNGDYLSIPTSSDWDIGTGDFTIEFWVNFDTVSQGSSSGHGHGASIIGNATNNGGDLVHEGWFFLVNHSGLVSFIYEDGSGVTNWDYNTLINQVEANKWYHIAVSRNGNILKGFVDGLPVHESSFTTYRHSNLSLELGRRTKSPLSNIQDYFKGYLQDLRISSKAVYTGCFKLPTTFQSEECIPTPTPIPQPTPTPTPERTPTPIRTRGILENDTSIGSKIATIQEQYGEFKVGDCVIINKGTNKEEKLTITQISFTAVTGIKYQSCETDYVAPPSDPDFELPSVPPKVNILKYEECEGLTLPEIVDYVLPETTDQTKVRKYAYCNDEWTAIETFDYELPSETIQDPILKYTQCDDSRPTLETFDYELPSETIQDPIRKYAKCGWVREVTLSFNYHIPNHPTDTNMANGTATKSHTISVTSGQPVVDFEFYHSFATGLSNEDEWTASNAKLTFPDNTEVSVDLTNRKVTSGTYVHPQNGNQTAFAVRYTFDVPNFVQDETQDFLDSIEYLLIVPPATDGVEDHNPTIISTDSINPKTLPTEWPTGTTYNYGDN